MLVCSWRIVKVLVFGKCETFGIYSKRILNKVPLFFFSFLVMLECRHFLLGRKGRIRARPGTSGQTRDFNGHEGYSGIDRFLLCKVKSYTNRRTPVKSYVKLHRN